jgi:hypothetical protein
MGYASHKPAIHRPVLALLGRDPSCADQLHACFGLDLDSLSFRLERCLEPRTRAVLGVGDRESAKALFRVAMSASARVEVSNAGQSSPSSRTFHSRMMKQSLDSPGA